MVFVLEDLELWDIVEAVVPPIPVTTPVLVAKFRKRNNKAKRTISDAVRDYIIPHLMGKACAYEMWASLCMLYESSNENRKMVLHDRLRGIRMLKDESVTSFLGRFPQIREELGAIGKVVDPNSLVRQAMNSFTKSWGPFVRGIVAREVMPTWERMWDDFVQEEIWLAVEASGQQQQIGQGEEDLALWTKGKKKVNRGGQQGPKFGAPPQGSGGGESSSGQGSGQKRDMSKVKCFICKKFGHYVGQCPNRKKKKGGTAATTEEIDFQTQFQRECAFLMLEYIRWCARFTTTIPSSPNHRPKPPSEHLNLDLRIPSEANPRLEGQTKSSASLPKDSTSQKADQIVQTLAKRYPRQILKLVAVAAAPATLLQTCAPAATAVRTNWENCSPEM
jgi:hypothetical protein